MDLSFVSFFLFSNSIICQAIASPSLSGSVARKIFEEDSAASYISLICFFDVFETSHSNEKSFSGSTDPFFDGRSLTCPKLARTL